MGDYYNATRGPLPATLVDGSAVSFGPKTWQYIPPEQEGSSSITKLLEKKFLVRSSVPITVEKNAEADAQKDEAQVAAQPAEKLAETAKPIEAKAEASTSSVKEEFRSKKR